MVLLNARVSSHRMTTPGKHSVYYLLFSENHTLKSTFPIYSENCSNVLSWGKKILTRFEYFLVFINSEKVDIDTLLVNKRNDLVKNDVSIEKCLMLDRLIADIKEARSFSTRDISNKNVSILESNKF